MILYYHGTLALAHQHKMAARFNYCFTYNNYTEDGEENLKLYLQEHCKYAIYGHETAPTTGTPHLQGFLSLKKKQRMQTIQNILLPRGINMSLLIANGTGIQNRVYCTKADPEHYFEHGDIGLTGQGSRTDLLEIAEKLKEGTTLETIAYDYPVEWIKYNKGIISLNSAMKKRKIPAFRDITVTVLVGTGGVGKTYKAITDCIALTMQHPYICNIPTKTSPTWWDNYDGEEGLLIDDFYGWMPPHELYRVLDKYKYQVQYKGGYHWAEWKYVWITSNSTPDQWYKKEVMEKLDYMAYNRRLHNIYLMEYSEVTGRLVHIQKEEKKIEIPIAPPVFLDLNAPLTQPAEEDEDTRRIVPDTPLSPVSVSGDRTSEESFSFDPSDSEEQLI